jgi:hypothetical protein
MGWFHMGPPKTTLTSRQRIKVGAPYLDLTAVDSCTCASDGHDLIWSFDQSSNIPST